MQRGEHQIQERSENGTLSLNKLSRISGTTLIPSEGSTPLASSLSSTAVLNLPNAATFNTVMMD